MLPEFPAPFSAPEVDLECGEQYILTVDFVPFQGLCRLGKTNIPVYDGSWTEWVTHPDTLNIVEVAETS